MSNRLVSVCPCCSENEPKKCPSCHDGNIKKVDFVENMFFYGCSNYPFCTHTYKACNYCKKALSIIDSKKSLYLCSDETCKGSVEKCKVGTGYLRRLVGPNGPFWGCTDNRETDCSSMKPYTDENAETCYQCSVGKITKSWNRRQNKPFWSCSEYSNGCKWTEPYGNSSS